MLRWGAIEEGKRKKKGKEKKKKAIPPAKKKNQQGKKPASIGGQTPMRLSAPRTFSSELSVFLFIYFLILGACWPPEHVPPCRVFVRVCIYVFVCTLTRTYPEHFLRTERLSVWVCMCVCVCVCQMFLLFCHFFSFFPKFFLSFAVWEIALWECEKSHFVFLIFYFFVLYISLSQDRECV